MLQQLRIYKIDEESFEEFIEIWTAGVYTSRQEQGWQIQAWADREQHQLVVLLGRDCTMEEWQAKEWEYYESPARTSLDPDPAQYILDGDEMWIEELRP